MKIQKILQARKLRKTQTPSERRLWQVLRNRKLLNFKFHRQYIVAGFILDFYCPVLKLGIEIDGKIHRLKENRIYDLERKKILKLHNINIVRFTNENIDKNLPNVIRQIKAYVVTIKNSPLYPEGVERG